MRKLALLVDGRRAQQWVHTAQLLSKIHNVNCTKENQMKPADFFNLHEKAKTQQEAKPGRKLTFKEKIAGMKQQIAP